jgi:hypothetical protein
MPLVSKDTFIDGFPVPLTAGGSSEVIYTFKAGLLSGDPGSGGFCLESATQEAAAHINISTLDIDGVDWSSSIDFFCSSTSTDKGQLVLRAAQDPTRYLIFKFVSFATHTGYRTLTLTLLGSSSPTPFADGDIVGVTFFRTGDKGDNGQSSETYSSFANVTGTSSALVDSWSGTVYRSAKYLIQISDGVNFETAELLMMHDGVGVHMICYGNVFNNGTLGNFDATMSTNLISLTFSATAATNKIIKFFRTAVPI